MAKKVTTVETKVEAEIPVKDKPRRKTSFMEKVKDLHWDKKKDKPAWHYILPSLFAAAGFYGVAQYHVVTVLSCFGVEFLESTLLLVTNGFDKSIEAFVISAGGYGVGAVANIFTKGGDVYTSQVTEEKTV